MNKERQLASSQAAHRRRVLAKERRNMPSDLLVGRITDIFQAEKRLAEVRERFEENNGLSLFDQAGLMVEEIWLEFRLEKITPAKRQSRLQRLLDTLEEERPEVYDWLTAEEGNKPPLLARIRDQVIPPLRIGGYYTKRRWGR